MRMDSQRHELLRHINECSDSFTSSSIQTSSLNLAAKLLEKDCEDPFINYGISGALKVYIVNCKSEADFRSLLSFFMEKLEDEQPCLMKLRIFTCLNGVMSSKTLMKVEHKDILIDLITGEWNQISSCMLKLQRVETSKFDGNGICVFEFFRLWKKVVKHVIKCENSNKFEKLDRMSQNNFKIWNMMSMLNNSLFIKIILKLFNCLLPYGELLSHSVSRNHVFYRQTAEYIFKFFHQKGFSRIHIGRGCDFIGVTMTTSSSSDTIQLRLMILLTLKATAIVGAWKDGSNDNTIDDCIQCLDDLDTFVKSNCKVDTDQFKHSQDHDDWVLEMFEDQDDMWIESLLILLDIFNQVILSRDFESLSTQLQTLMNPHQQFLVFLKSTDFDDSVLVDLLTSPETCFLLYFTCYLKCIKKEWILFLKTAQQLTLKEQVLLNPNTKIYNINSQEKTNMILINNKEIETKPADKTLNRQDFPASSCGLTLLGLYESDDDNDEIVSPDSISDEIISLDNISDEIISLDDKGDGTVSDDDKTDGLSIEYKTDVNNIDRINDISCTDSMYDKIISLGERIDDEILAKKTDKGNHLEQITETAVIQEKEEVTSTNISSHHCCYLNDELAKTNNKQDEIMVHDVNEYNVCKASQQEIQNKSNTNTTVSDSRTKAEFLNQEKLVDDVISCIIRVRLKIDKLCRSDLFPYNPEPLIFHIAKLEDLYENYSFSQFN